MKDEGVGNGREGKRRLDIRDWSLPFGAAKWITLPSSLNMLTSSIA